jgi:hypothetical protein
MGSGSVKLADFTQIIVLCVGSLALLALFAQAPRIAAKATLEILETKGSDNE